MSLMLTDDARPYSGKGIIITIERCRPDRADKALPLRA